MTSRGGGASENNAPVRFWENLGLVFLGLDVLGKFRFLRDLSCGCSGFSIHGSRHCERKCTHEHPVPYASNISPTAQASNPAYVYNYRNKNSSACAKFEIIKRLDCFAFARNDGTTINKSGGNEKNENNVMNLFISSKNSSFTSKIQIFTLPKVLCA